MHEMSLTESVVEILCEEGRRQGFARVKTVWLEIGTLSGVEPGAMEFCFDVVDARDAGGGRAAGNRPHAGAGLVPGLRKKRGARRTLRRLPRMRRL